jgi:hypothetical protein
MVTILRNKSSRIHQRTEIRRPFAKMSRESSASRDSEELLGEEAPGYSLDPKCPQRPRKEFTPVLQLCSIGKSWWLQ